MPPVIDSHTHWTPPVLLEALEKRDAAPRIVSENGSRMVELAPGQRFPLKDDSWNEDVKLAKMDRDRIDLAVISAVGGIAVVDILDEPEQQPVARETNEQIAALVARHPGRFAGLAALPMLQPERAVEELEHAAGLGLKGAMLYSNVAGRYLDAPEFRPVFETAEALELTIQIHPTHPLSAEQLETGFLVTAVGFLFDTTTATLRLIQDGIYENLPRLKLHLGHVGSLLPYVIERIDFQASLFPKDLAKLSSPPSEHIARLYTDSVCSWEPALRTAVEFFGADQVMFGTDDPYWPAQPAHDTLEALGLSDDDAERLRWRTATELYGLEPLASAQ